MELLQQKKQIIFKTCFALLLISILALIIYNLVGIINYFSSYGEIMERANNSLFPDSIDYHNREFSIKITQLIRNIIFLILVLSNFALLFISEEYLKLFILFDIVIASTNALIFVIIIRAIECSYIHLLLENSIIIITIMSIIMLLILILLIPQIFKEIRLLKCKSSNNKLVGLEDRSETISSNGITKREKSNNKSIT